jgi:hypothetical protein
MNIKSSGFGLLAMAGVVAAPLSSNAQSITYLDHPGSVINSGQAIQSDSWLGISFQTGTNSGGYSLDSMTMYNAGIAGNPSGFQFLLYADNMGVPGSEIELLSGASPTGVGNYTFTSSGVTLAPNTVYWAVATAADSSISGNSYYWAFDPNAATTIDGWSLGIDASSLGGGDSWYSSGGVGSPFTLSINAEPTPEPGAFSLMGLGLLAVAGRKWGKLLISKS